MGIQLVIAENTIISRYMWGGKEKSVREQGKILRFVQNDTIKSKQKE